MALTKDQKNGLLAAIRANGKFEPADFSVVARPGLARVTHQPTKSVFDIRSSSERGFYGNSTVGDALDGRYGDPDNKYGDELGRESWPEVIRLFMRWLKNVTLESETPDMWEDLRRGSLFLDEAVQEVADNTPFTGAEQAQIAVQLKDIKEYVAESRTLSAGQAARLDARFDEAEEASRRLGRKDWILLLGGALFSLVLSAVAPPEVMQHVLIMTEQGLGHLFGGSPPQIPRQAS